MSTAKQVFSIKKDFSDAPGPRFLDEGNFSGELLRRDHLVPLIRDSLVRKQKVLVDLDGTYGYLTSFLEEAFGGLIRNDGFTLQQVYSVFDFKSLEEPYLVDDIKEYLSDAAKKSR